ncbi:hypothetical protein [Paenibacillus sp. GCM10012303]|uniref:hypothetical protein n=1 Tax=Paenibacillus sp. GCM10012303 TaxID=3317340 RepID=UPI003610D7AF
MGAVIVPGVQLANESESYIDAMHAVLSHKGWMAHPKPMLSGMTVAGFRFTVNRRLTAESVTAYNWIAENFLAADFIGVSSSQNAGFTFDATFPLYQRQAVSDIKASIGRGTAAIIWKDQFVVAAGYDDCDEVLYIADGKSSEYVTVPYGQFGRNDSPYWYYQLLEDRIEIEESAIFQESFVQAVYKWESHDLMLPEAEYACGRRAYDAIVEALRSGDYDSGESRHVFRCYAAAKRDIGEYARRLELVWPEIGTAAAHYSRVSGLFRRIAERACAPDTGSGPYEPETVRELIGLFREAQYEEELATGEIRALLNETIHNRFHDIGLR